MTDKSIQHLSNWDNNAGSMQYLRASGIVALMGLEVLMTHEYVLPSTYQQLPSSPKQRRPKMLVTCTDMYNQQFWSMPVLDHRFLFKHIVMSRGKTLGFLLRNCTK